MTYDSTLRLDSPTYHLTVIESKTILVSPAAGVVITATSALTDGVISDSKATVETIKAFEVNRIVYREYFERCLWARNVLDLGDKRGKYRRL